MPTPQENVERARRDCDKALTRLSQARGTGGDGAEIEYASAHKRLSEARHAAGESGYLGVRRRKYMVGL